ncbi:unnamed protein product, partial [Amoebophrya sp. A120]
TNRFSASLGGGRSSSGFLASGARSPRGGGSFHGSPVRSTEMMGGGPHNNQNGNQHQSITNSTNSLGNLMRRGSNMINSTDLGSVTENVGEEQTGDQELRASFNLKSSLGLSSPTMSMSNTLGGALGAGGGMNTKTGFFSRTASTEKVIPEANSVTNSVGVRSNNGEENNNNGNVKHHKNVDHTTTISDNQQVKKTTTTSTNSSPLYNMMKSAGSPFFNMIKKVTSTSPTRDHYPSSSAAGA